MTGYEQNCLDHADYFTAVRGRGGVSSRTREEFPTLDAAVAYGVAYGDRRTMIYAVIGSTGQSAHITNA